jgi:hypothetical protein
MIDYREQRFRGLAVCLLASVCLPAFGQAQNANAGTALSAVTRTMYTNRTELFAEFRPLIAGQATRLTAHLTKLGERFQAYSEGKVKLTLTIGDSVLESRTEAPERPGVFRLMVTPPKAGVGRMTIEVTAGGPPEMFTIDNAPVYSDLQAALEKQQPAESGLISYAKEKQWDTEFATAVPGGNSVPAAAVLQEQGASYVYVQRTPEAFELREVKTGATANSKTEIVSGLRPGDRIVTLGADKMPRKR